MNKNTTIIIALLVILLGAGAIGYFVWNEKSKPVVETPPEQTVTSIEYKNTNYGFTFTLPASWTRYSIVTDKWEGQRLDVQNSVKVEGPQILIRHPQWTSASPRQDIPIMIFTPDQWDLISQEKLAVGAAPIGPTELGRNANYVFALPARYNFAFLTGFEEVEQILHLPTWETNPALQTF